MSTGRRLAKRSIIGTRVCAPGPDGLWYSGVIQDVKTPPSTSQPSENNNCINLTPDTKYTVRFDFKTTSSATAAATAASSTTMQQQSNDNHKGSIVPSPLAGTGTGNGVRAISPAPSSSSSPSPSSSSSSSSVSVSVSLSNSSVLSSPGRCNVGNTGGVIMDARQHSIRSSNLLINSPAQSLRRSVMMKEFRETDLIGPGFRSIMEVQLHPSQRVFLTYNGRETSGDVVSHDLAKDEVIVRIMHIGSEEPIELKKRLEEVRLLESRRSARLADQDRDTNFARLADMGGDRRRTSSNNIDVPSAPQHNSRKRRPSYTQEERDNYLTQCRDDDEIKLCNAALVLMHLSGSPLSPKDNLNSILGSSPGSSSAWSSGSSSPPLSDDGKIFANHLLDSARMRTTSLSTSDEGIVMDYSDDAPRKRRVSEGHSSVPRREPKPVNKRIFKCTWRGCDFTEKTSSNIERHVRDAHIGPKKARRSVEDDGSFSDSDHEEEFYYTEIEDEDDEGKAPSPPSPPTLSHRDMARPPHEDPEYQRQIVGSFKQGLAQPHLVNSKYIHISNNGANNNQQNQYNTSNTISIPSSPLAHHNYTWPSPVPAQQQHHPQQPQQQQQQQQQNQQQQQSPVSPIKHPRWSPRPSTSVAPYPSPTYVHHHHHNYSSSSSSSSCSSAGSPNSTSSHINHQMPHQTINHHQSSSVSSHQPNQQQQQQQHHQQQPHYHQLMQHSIPNSTTVTLSPNIHHTGNNQQHQQQHQHHNHQQQQQHHHNHRMQTSSSPATITATVTTTHRLQSPNIQSKSKGTPNSPNRRTRGENKKCRKVYGMERREQWCTQCKWKKACSRFGD
ncbi:uncharacterized protein LOC129942280 [Eupeodes corollae]|uniref:uncharacterized protein LOC129942280 n=1 Tax=Eupeodes corollae TaxID=290404 RepID=UPI00248FA957|nr:uncharacterized protein LOC129942280 [Eupeodes corollae]